MQKDVDDWTRTCHSCQRSKITRHVSAPHSSFNLPTQRFAVIHVDLVVLPPSKGYRYMLTIVDRFSRWMECIPLENMTAETVVRTIYNEWIPRYGCPQTIVTDQGRQFESEIFKIFASSFGIHLNRTTAYHPQCNGLVERLHRTLKTALMCHDADSWTLPMVLLGLRTQFKEVLQAFAAEVLYGEPLRIPGEFFTPTQDLTLSAPNFAREHQKRMVKLRPAPVKAHGEQKVFVYQNLATCPFVYLRTDFVRKPLQVPYTGPHKVLERSEKTFVIQFSAKKT
ncbi:Hypothetical predicted protein [Cloeon dipterum]|uniref:Integrase catalytic domain-containing protein n=1 Tax=Cloeon dipterum TaxID=197152 RepID=A0A8S1DIB5_9INSE|nr:Hypothetical predicted protein [Cloeon dipterum]